MPVAPTIPTRYFSMFSILLLQEIQKCPQGCPAVRRGPGMSATSLPLISAPPGLHLMTAADLSGLQPSAEGPASPLPFGAACLHAASAEAIPPPHYPRCAPLIFYVFFGYRAYSTTENTGCQRRCREEHGKDRLCVISQAFPAKRKAASTAGKTAQPDHLIVVFIVKGTPQM